MIEREWGGGAGGVVVVHRTRKNERESTVFQLPSVVCLSMTENVYGYLQTSELNNSGDSKIRSCIFRQQRRVVIYSRDK